MNDLSVFRIYISLLICLSANVLFAVNSKVTVTEVPILAKQQSSKLSFKEKIMSKILLRKIQPSVKVANEYKRKNEKTSVWSIVSIIAGLLSCIPLAGIYFMPIAIAACMITLRKMKKGKISRKGRKLVIAALAISLISLILHGIFYLTFDLG